MSLQFWVVIKLLDKLINRYTFGMWSCYDSVICQNTSGMLSHHWHIGILLGCGPAAGFTVMSVQMWDVILLYVSLICQYTFVMWLYCMFHCSVSTLLGVILLWDSLICKYTRGMWSYCRIHWYITTFLGCDATVWFTDMMVHFYNTTQHCISEDSSLHICQCGNLRSHPEEIFIYDFEEETGPGVA